MLPKQSPKDAYNMEERQLFTLLLQAYYLTLDTVISLYTVLTGFLWVYIIDAEALSTTKHNKIHV